MANTETNPISLDYIAGFFDGEGSVTIKVSRDQKRKYNFYFGGRIVITNTKREVLENIRKTLGFGGVMEKKKDSAFAFVITNERECINFIKLLKDRVFLKKEQLELLEEFFEVRRKCRDWHYSKEKTLSLLNIVAKLQMLNRGRVTKHLTKVIEFVKQFNENEYRKRMEELIRTRRGKMKGNQFAKAKLPQDEIVHLYVEKKLTCPKIAEMYGVNSDTIRRRLRQLGVELRKPPIDLLMHRGIIHR